MSNKLATNTCSLPLYQEISYLSRPSDTLIMKRFHANFEVIRDEEGNLCAADKRQMIFTDGRNEKELIENIRDALECYFEVSVDEIDYNLVYK